MIVEKSQLAPLDLAAAWAVVAFGVIAISLSGILYLPKLAHTFTGEAVFMLMIFAALMAVGGVIVLCAATGLAWRSVRAYPPGSVWRYMHSLRIPIGIVIANAVVGLLVNDNTQADRLFIGIRIFATVQAGWLSARKGSSLWVCAISGLLLMAIDHLAIKTIAFVLTQQWVAIGGVLISFAMFAIIPISIAAASGYFAKRLPSSKADAGH